MRIRLLMVAGLTALIVPAQAQSDDPRNLSSLLNPDVVREINLQPSQRQQIRRIFQEYRPKLLEQRSIADRAETDLREVFNQDPPDQKRGLEAADRLAGARAEILRLNTVMRLRWRAVLTKEQWTDLQRKYPNGVRPRR